MLINTHTHKELSNGDVEIVNIEPGSVHRPRLFSCGIHPWHVSEKDEEALIASLNEMAGSENCLAIGECGLDRTGQAPLEIQQRFFLRQVQLANEYGKPLLIHCVKAFSELLSCLHHSGNQVPVIIHGFNNNENTARLLSGEGCYFSFGKALMGYDSNAARALRNIGRKKILLETDNAEIGIGQLYKKAAELLGVEQAILEAQVQQNFETVFNVSI